MQSLLKNSIVLTDDASREQPKKIVDPSSHLNSALFQKAIKTIHSSYDPHVKLALMIVVFNLMFISIYAIHFYDDWDI